MAEEDDEVERQQLLKQPYEGRMGNLRSRISNIAQNSLLRTTLKNGMLILTWYFLSTALGLYNKQLVGKNQGIFGHGSFPAPLLMSSIQFALQAMLAKLVFQVGLLERTQTKPISWGDWCRLVLPNGVTTGLDIGFSNKSLVLIKLSFYTMCKSTVPIFLLLFAFIWKIERPSWLLAGVVCIISTGLILLVEGETDFDPVGFILVMLAALLSGLRFTLTQVSLHGHHDAVALGGPLEMLEMLTPLMSVTVLLLSIASEQLWSTLPASPYFMTWQHMLVTVCIILVGAVMAFLMVWTEYKVIKETSALTFMIAGTVKEVVTVVAAVIVMHDTFGPVNVVGLVIVMLGVVLFNWYKYRKVKSGEILAARPGLTNRLDKDRERERNEGSNGVVELEPLIRVASPHKGDSPSRSGQLEMQPLLPLPGVMVHR